MVTRLIFGVLIGCSVVVEAQVADTVLKAPPKADEAAKEGWSRTLNIGSGLSFGSSDQVVGQPDGNTNTFGLDIVGQMNHLQGRDEWRNSLKIGESATQTPAVPRYSKVKDEFKFETLFLHTLEAVPWFGPYVKASAEAPIFKGEDIRSTPKTYEIHDTTGAIVETRTDTTLRLTDGFRPLTTKESAGGFFKLVERPTNKVEGRVGLGAIQVSADGQRAIADVGSTPQTEVKTLESFSQAGLEAALTWNGNWDSKSTYSLEAEMLTPFVGKQKAGDNRSKLELTNWEVKGKLTTKVYDWLAIDYSAKIFRQPQLLDKTQSQTLLMMNLTYVIF